MDEIVLDLFHSLELRIPNHETRKDIYNDILPLLIEYDISLVDRLCQEYEVFREAYDDMTTIDLE